MRGLVLLLTLGMIVIVSGCKDAESIYGPGLASTYTTVRFRNITGVDDVLVECLYRGVLDSYRLKSGEAETCNWPYVENSYSYTNGVLTVFIPTADGRPIFASRSWGVSYWSQGISCMIELKVEPREDGRYDRYAELACTG